MASKRKGGKGSGGKGSGGKGSATKGGATKGGKGGATKGGKGGATKGGARKTTGTRKNRKPTGARKTTGTRKNRKPTGARKTTKASAAAAGQRVIARRPAAVTPAQGKRATVVVRRRNKKDTASSSAGERRTGRRRDESPRPQPRPQVAARRVTSDAGDTVIVENADLAAAERLVEQVRARRERIAGDFYAMGDALLKLAKPQLYGALGYRSFGELLADRQLVSRTVAFKLMAVVKAYPRDQALELGVEKAYGLIRWTEASGAERSPSELVANNARVGDARVRELTTRALQEQLRRVRETTTPDDQRRAARAEADRTARALQHELHGQGLDTARARARRIRGRWHVTVDVPADDAEQWLEQK